MSRVRRDAYHAARLLQNELGRIASKRERAIAKANGDFQLELIQAVSSSSASTLKLVVAVLREDVGQLHLSRALETTISANDDGHERETEPPLFELRSRVAPSEPSPPTEVSGDWVSGDGSGTALPPIDAEFEEVARLPEPLVFDDEPVAPEIVFEGRRYRYPEPGENAASLASGEVVAADEAGEPIQLGAAP